MQGYKDWNNPRFRSMMMPRRYRSYYRGRSSRRTFKRSRRGQASFGSGITNPKFLGGVALGVIAPTVIPNQDAIMTALAVLPVPKMGLGGVFRGYVIGRLGRAYVPALNFGSAGGNGGDFA